MSIAMKEIIMKAAFINIKKHLLRRWGNYETNIFARMLA